MVVIERANSWYLCVMLVINTGVLKTDLAIADLTWKGSSLEVGSSQQRWSHMCSSRRVSCPVVPFSALYDNPGHCSKLPRKLETGIQDGVGRLVKVESVVGEGFCFIATLLCSRAPSSSPC